MDLLLVEELKNMLKGIKSFMTLTLKDVSLKTDVVNQKTAIVTSITKVLQKLDQIAVDDIDEVSPISAQQLKDPSKVGILVKKREQGFGFQKLTRYCVIKDNIMYYYKNRKDKKQAGAIVLNGYDIKSTIQEQEGVKEYAFELIHRTKRCYKFVAEDLPALTAWIKAVEVAINNQTEKLDGSDIESEDDVFEKDCKKCGDDETGVGIQSNIGYYSKKEYELPNDNKRLSDACVTETPSLSEQSEVIPEESIPPPPNYPPPPMPRENIQLEKRPSQSECFQAFASDLKSRLVKVDVPSVPQQRSKSLVDTREINKMKQQKFVPIKPLRNFGQFEEPYYDEISPANNLRKQSRKKPPVPLPSNK